jgi:ketosteroid isomerase-like protein
MDTRVKPAYDDGCMWQREHVTMRGQQFFRTSRLFISIFLAFIIIRPVIAQSASPDTDIRAALTQWRDDFNAGRADKICDIFAPSLRADVRGVPERDFDSQCALLHHVLGDDARSFSYALDLKEIVAEGDMAVVRLVWTLTTRVKATGAVTTTEEQGLDVFGRASDGRWRIIRFITFERP